jgi:hypothetical protein
VSGHARARWPRRAAAALLALLAPAAVARALGATSPDVPAAVTVGRVTAVAWPRHADLAAVLAELADRAAPFPGLGPLPDRAVRLVLAPTRAVFDSITRQRLPAWSEGAAFPDRALIVLLAVGPPDRMSVVLRHELAHLALRWRLGHRAPLWFEEGYAAVAAGEWGRLDALRLNWQIAAGAPLELDAVDRALRGERGDAASAYALATTAVALLHRWGGERGLGPLLEQLAREPGFEAAIRATYYVTGDDFEARWRRDVRDRYGWLAWASGVGFFWAVAGAVLVALVMLRRRRDRARRARLDDGWVVAGDDAAQPDRVGCPTA